MCGLDRNVVIALAVLAGGLAVYYILYSKRENYGAMKNIKKIPFNDCRRICETYHARCISDFKDADPSWCDRRLAACTEECYYTPYQQLQG